MPLQPQSPPSFAESNAVLTSDSGEKLQRKIALLLGGGCKGAVVTPSDGADLPNPGRVWVGGTAGAVKIDCLLTGTTLTIGNVPSGSFVPVMARRVYATGTAATQMIVVY